jgi:hypothetical protein
MMCVMRNATAARHSGLPGAANAHARHHATAPARKPTADTANAHASVRHDTDGREGVHQLTRRAPK